MNPPDQSPTRNFWGNWKPRAKPHLFRNAHGDWYCVVASKRGYGGTIGIAKTALEAQQRAESLP
jgi:hypothetical protein